MLNMKSLSEIFSLVYDPVLAAHVEALFHGCPSDIVAFELDVFICRQ